jgi:hypothetical protein
VVSIREKRNTYKVLVIKPEGTNHFKDLATDGQEIFK